MSRRWLVERIGSSVGESGGFHPGTVRLTEIHSETHREHISPDESLKVRNHSPTGFEMGYLGSGPSQLALAIMLRYYANPANQPEACDDGGVRAAQLIYHDFKQDFVAQASREGFDVTEDEITRWIRKEPRP